MNEFITIFEARQRIFASATKYGPKLGTWSQAVLSLIDEAISLNRLPDKDGWLFVGDILKRFNDIHGRDTKTGCNYWLSLVRKSESDPTKNCELWKTETIFYEQ